MDALVSFLSNYGYTGMAIAAFLAGSFIPFSSEAVMLALYAAGLHPWALILSGTIGNVSGSMFNYGIGRFGKPEWISKYLHVKQDRIEKTKRFMAGRGAWMGIFAFLPILGSAITIVLGLMRANIIISTTSISIGKFIRYVILIYGASLIFG